MSGKPKWGQLKSIYRPTNPPFPDFDRSINVVLGTFAVIIGVAIQNFLDPKVAENLKGLYWFAFVMLITILLRYLVGSAVHFNFTYGNRQAPQTQQQLGPRTISVGVFFKDLLFLVLFGAVAVGITQAREIGHFERRIMWFLALGALWSAVDIAIRKVGYRNAALPAPPVNLSCIWIGIDLSQLLLTWVVVRLIGFTVWSGGFLAGLYLLYLFFDLLTLIRWMQGQQALEAAALASPVP